MVCCVAALAVLGALGGAARRLLRLLGRPGADVEPGFAPPARHAPHSRADRVLAP